MIYHTKKQTLSGEINTALRYPGGKVKLAPWIISNFPPHKFYLEPFFGAGSVFFTKEPSLYETINDLDGMVTNFFRICRDYPKELASLINLTPYARNDFLSIQETASGKEINLTGNALEDARRFAVRCWQGFGSKLSDRVGWKNTKSAKGSRNPDLWNGLPETIIAVAQRLKNAQIENTDAIDLIRKCNTKECFIYADPPYLMETSRSRMYRCEMGDEESHIKLLDALLAHKGTVMISGYDNPLYNEMLSGWSKARKTATTNSATLRTEVLWMNYRIQESLFD